MSYNFRWKLLVSQLYQSFIHLLSYSLSIILFTELTLNPPEGIIAGPVNEENFFEWEALIMYVYHLW